jgi:DNA polymerase III sliding clamp (beta) subunit (PCNA family)
MRALIENTKIFKTIISAISRVFPELVFEFSESGMRISAVTPNHLAVAEGFLNGKFFSQYRTKGSSRLSLNLDSEMLRKIILQVGANPLMIYNIGAWLVFEVRAITIRSFSIRTKAPWERPINISKLNYMHKINVDPSAFRQLINDASVVSEELNIFCEMNRISFSSEGESWKYDFGGTRERADNPSARVMLSDLKKLVQLTYVAKTVTVSAGKDLPVRIEFEFDDGHFVFTFSSKVI